MLQNLIQQLENLEGHQISLGYVAEILERYIIPIPEAETLTIGEYTSGYRKFPVECREFNVSLIKWPPGASSDVHQHNGFWGVIKVVKGQIAEQVFEFDEPDRTLTMYDSDYIPYGPGDVLLEETSAIHKVVNCSTSLEAITLHVYYPVIFDYDNVRLFDLERKRIGILNSEATGSCWDNQPHAFHRVIENGFRLVESEY